MILNCRDKNLPLMTFYINSQHCESFFRSMRSWAGCQSTKIDGTVFECLSTMRDIQTTQDSKHHLLHANYNFSNKKYHELINSYNQDPLPDDQAIATCLSKCLGDVARELEVIFGNIFVDDVKVPHDVIMNDCELENDEPENNEPENDEPRNDENEIDDDDVATHIKKQFLYALNSGQHTGYLNKDRRQRFASSDKKKMSVIRNAVESIVPCDTLCKNDFVVFDKYLIGCVVDFRKNVKMTAPILQFTYTLNYAKRSDDALVRLQLYKLIEIQDDARCMLKLDNYTYENLLSIKRYSIHIPTPEYINGNMIYSEIVRNQINEYISSQMEVG